MRRRQGYHITESGHARPALTWASAISDRLRLDALDRCRHIFRGDLLDVGCGMRPYEPRFRNRVRRWVGVDRPHSAAGTPAADIYADSLTLPIRDAAVDTVLCTQVLEHVPDPALMMREIARVLRAGGRLLLTAPQTNPLHEEPHDYYRYTKYGLAYLAERAGLSVVAVEPMGGAIATVAQQIVWHAAPINRLPRIGPRAYGALIAPVQWAALRLDRLAVQYLDGGQESTIGYLLVAEKRPD
jgi:ubiquinone/menaquinone biosynthesis C-methylase UbiE